MLFLETFAADFREAILDLIVIDLENRAVFLPDFVACVRFSDYSKADRLSLSRDFLVTALPRNLLT